MDANGFSLIITTVNRGYSDTVMEAARSVGARGGTVVHAMGTGKAETDKFLGMEIHPEKEIVLILSENSNRHNIMVAIYKVAGLDTDAGGYSFSMPVEEIIGAPKLPHPTHPLANDVK